MYKLFHKINILRLLLNVGLYRSAWTSQSFWNCFLFFCVDIKNFSVCLWWNVPVLSTVTSIEILNVAVFYTSGDYSEKNVAVLRSTC